MKTLAAAIVLILLAGFAPLGQTVVIEHVGDAGGTIAVGRSARQAPEGLAAFHKAEIEKWWPIIRAAGIKVE